MCLMGNLRMCVLKSHQGFTRHSSIGFSLGMARDIVPLVTQVPSAQISLYNTWYLINLIFKKNLLGTLVRSSVDLLFLRFFRRFFKLGLGVGLGSGLGLGIVLGLRLGTRLALGLRVGWVLCITTRSYSN